MSDGRLGCASEYIADLLFVPRNDARRAMWTRSPLPNVARVTWGRRLNETSEATIEIATVALSAECCQLLSEPDYWCFEVRLTRIGADGSTALVWEGPITRIEYRTGDAPTTITCSDVSDWFNGPYGIANLANNTYSTPTPVAEIAAQIVRDSMELLPVYDDHPLIADYLYVMPGSPAITYRRGQVNEYIADTIADLQTYGMDWTTIGRRIIYMPVADSTNRPPGPGLSDADVTGTVTVTRDGHEYGNVGISSVPFGEGLRRYTYGTGIGLYGKHDRITATVSDDDATDADLRAVARQAIAGRTQPQIAVGFSSTMLRSSAPITIDQLVPGATVNFTVAGLCIPVQAVLQIVDVTGEWVPGGTGRPGVERISCGLTQLGDVTSIAPPDE